MIRVLQWRIGLSGDGVTRSVLNACRELPAEEFENVYITGEQDTGACARLIGGDARVLSLPVSPLFHPLRFRRAADLLLKAADCDILHFNASYFLTTYLLRAAKRRGMRVVLHAHSSEVDIVRPVKRRIFRLLHRLNRRRAVRCADVLLTCSDAAASWIFGRESGRAIFWPNAVDTGHFAYRPDTRQEVRAAEEWDGRLVIGMVGRFAYPKNHAFALDVLEALRRQNPDTLLVFAGTGELEETIRWEADRRGLGQAVRFLGLREDVDRLMQGMDALLMPSRFEGLPLTLIEAQCAGLPCLVSRAVTEEAAVTDLVIRLPLGDPESWAQRLYESAPRNQRRDRSGDVAAAGFERRTRTEETEKLYRRLAAERNGGNN